MEVITAMITANSRLSLAKLYRMQWEDKQNCYVLLFPEGMIQLNISAGEILSRLQKPCLYTDLIADLQQAYPDVVDLKRDVEEFLQTATDNGWIDHDG